MPPQPEQDFGDQFFKPQHIDLKQKSLKRNRKTWIIILIIFFSFFVAAMLYTKLVVEKEFIQKMKVCQSSYECNYIKDIKLIKFSPEDGCYNKLEIAKNWCLIRPGSKPPDCILPETAEIQKVLNSLILDNSMACECIKGLNPKNMQEGICTNTSVS